MSILKVNSQSLTLEVEGQSAGNLTYNIVLDKNGEELSFDDFIVNIIDSGVEHDIRYGNIHLCFDLRYYDYDDHASIVDFLNDYQDWYHENSGGSWDYHTFVRLKINGNKPILEDLIGFVDELQCEILLQHSGVSLSERLKTDVIKSVVDHGNYQFIVIVRNESDAEEMYRDFIVPFQIRVNNIYISCDNPQTALEMAKKYVVKVLPEIEL
jgi:hypothetical protein